MLKSVANGLYYFTIHKSVKLIVDDAIVLNIVIALIFISLLYFPTKLNKEKNYLNFAFTDSLRGISMFMIMMHSRKE